MLAYFDCFAGVAGDMTIAALLDAGLDEEYLRTQLAALDLEGYRIRVWRSSRRGVAGTRFHVDVEADQPSRSYADIVEIIRHSALGASIKDWALAVFDLIADAEGKIHGKPKKRVHFHEVGAVDSIIDVVGASIGFEALGIDRMICSPLPMTRGFVNTAHGTLPTPAPATLEILKGTPVTSGRGSLELVTPTGAAIVSAFAESFGEYPAFVPSATGYGLGTSDPKEFPNALRVVLGEEKTDRENRDRVDLLECQVDDLDGRLLGSLMDRLFAQGALDVSYTPAQMKKNRPGTLIRALAPPNLTDALAETLLIHTTTLGVRVVRTERIIVPRSVETVETSLGTIRVKIVRLPNGRIERRPEFDDIRSLADRTGRSERELLAAIQREVDT